MNGGHARVKQTNIFKIWRLEDFVPWFSFWKLHLLVPCYWLFKGTSTNLSWWATEVAPYQTLKRKHSVLTCFVNRNGDSPVKLTPSPFHSGSSHPLSPSHCLNLPAAAASNVFGWQLRTWRFAGRRLSWPHNPSPWIRHMETYWNPGGWLCWGSGEKLQSVKPFPMIIWSTIYNSHYYHILIFNLAAWIVLNYNVNFTLSSDLPFSIA